MVDEVRHRGKAPPFSFPGRAAEAATANANAKEQQHKRAVEKKSGASSNNNNNPQAEHRSASSMPAATAGQRGKKVSALINRGVEWETWLVGLQHKLLLGVAPTEDVVGPPLGKKRERNDSGNNNVACGCGWGNTVASAPSRSGQQQQQRSSGCKRCGRKRYLYRMVAAAADISERASFHRGFLCWTYASRLLAAGFFFLVAVYLNALATMVATHRNPYAMLLDRSGEPLGAHTLPDLGHDLWALLLNRLGHHTDYIDEHALPDRMVSFAGMVGDLFILCHPQRLKIMRRVFIIFGTVLMMRAVSVSVTVLPDASPVCRERFEEDAAIAELFPGAFLEAARFVWSPTSFVTCGDMVFSGHTTCLVMVAMTFRRYCRASELQTKVLLRGFHLSEGVLSAVRRAVYAYVALGALVIIGSKLHYTLDVLLAVLVTFWRRRGGGMGRGGVVVLTRKGCAQFFICSMLLHP
ncbi:conserved unknown protein [Ectocarpus siliculosus]|uniref:Sphingomyelin synthase-like domain-containing protein n=1 Tax=Ectocarpus siliculosus TaxID=2880 RepID=D7FZR1_ECTSI|nr:conserved unknown protein [Ectocarpus siliculosus]|eukprot:CBJ32868.1 conserved unknown protein [Ectocarpus siliculosus]